MDGLTQTVITTAEAVSERAFATELITKTMELRGILPGDILICEPPGIAKPKDGSMVLYEAPGAEELRLGQLHGRMLLHHDAAGTPPVAIKDVLVVGIGVEQKRRLNGL